MARRTLYVTYFASYMIAIANCIRAIDDYYHCDCDALKTIALLIAVYLVLLFTEPLLIRQNRIRAYIYMIAQIAIILALAFNMPGEDFWALMILPLIAQAMVNFEPRTGYIFTGIFTAIMPFLLIPSLGPASGFPLMLIYGSAYFLLAAFIVIVREAVAARDESQKQKTELQAAHQQLQAYTEQAEELAVLEERNRLARELHDSITQSLHSVTLMAEAGQRLASSGDIEQVRGYLIRLGEISQQALREMRLLVYELRPLALLDVGLVGALQQRLDAVERRAGVEVHFSCDDEIEIPEIIEEELYRIAMEALNNSLHHANPTSVEVTLQKKLKRELPCIELSIIDNGAGFDPADKRNQEGFGLSSMRERIEKLGGELDIRSAPGEGTKVIACVNLVGPSEIPPEE